MENNELDNIDEIQNIDEYDTAENGAGYAIKGLILASGVAIGMGIQYLYDRMVLKNERSKNIQYQETIRKHQAEINELKSWKERRDYLDKLWLQLQAEIEE